MVRLTLLSFFVFNLISSSIFAQENEAGPPCKYFYQKLEDFAHSELTHQNGEIIFSWDRKKYKGCKITFVTNDSLRKESPNLSLPLFWPKKDTTLYQKGWRSNKNYQADGPGSTAYGIEKADTLCLISERQPATFVEPGKIEHSSKLTIEVECRIK